MRAARAGVAAAAPGKLIVVAATPGVGKTHATLAVLVEEARRRRRTTFLTHNHRLAAEALERTRPMTDLPLLHVKGALQECRHYARADEDRRADIARAYLTGGRFSLCGDRFPADDRRRCRYLDQCPGAQSLQALEFGLTFGVHASLTKLGRASARNVLDVGEAADPLDVLDELPSPTRLTVVTASALDSLYREAPTGRDWRERNPLTGELARAIREFGDRQGISVAQAEGDEVRRFAKRIWGSELLAALAAADYLVAAAAAASAELGRAGSASRKADAPRPPAGDASRDGRSRYWPDRLAWDLVQAIAASVNEASQLGPWELRIDPDGSAVWELREVYKLQPDSAHVLLDGTAVRSRAVVEAIAHANGLSVDFRTINAIGGVPAAAVHFKTGALRSCELWRRKGRAVAFRDRAAGAVANIFARIRDLARKHRRDQPLVGIITHKPLADVFRVGLGKEPERPEFEYDAGEIQDPAAAACAEAIRQLSGAGWRFIIGHHGADDRGTNAFKGVDIMVVLGPLRPDWGATEADARALGTDADELFESRTASAHVQALARARHLRRGGPDSPILVYVGPDDAPVGPDLPMVRWQLEVVTTAPAPPPTQGDALDALRDLADDEGALSPAYLGDMALSRKALDRAVEQEARSRGWRKFFLPARKSRVVVWAADQQSASRFLESRPD